MPRTLCGVRLGLRQVLQQCHIGEAGMYVLRYYSLDLNGIVADLILSSNHWTKSDLETDVAFRSHQLQ